MVQPPQRNNERKTGCSALLLGAIIVHSVNSAHNNNVAQTLHNRTTWGGTNLCSVFVIGHERGLVLTEDE